MEHLSRAWRGLWPSTYGWGNGLEEVGVGVQGLRAEGQDVDIHLGPLNSKVRLFLRQHEEAAPATLCG